MAVACVARVEAQAPRPSRGQESQAKAAERRARRGRRGRRRPRSRKKKKQDPAEAQRAIDAALKLLEAGKADQAAQALTAVLGGGNLPPAIMAKALLYRGIAYRQQKKPAQAIADLTSALWLKGGLSEADRADALRQRTAAYQEAGLAESGGAVAAAVPNARAPPRARRPPTGLEHGDADQRPREPAAAQSSSGWSSAMPLRDCSAALLALRHPLGAAGTAAACARRLRHRSSPRGRTATDVRRRHARAPAAGPAIPRCSPAARCARRSERAGGQARGPLPHPGRHGAQQGEAQALAGQGRREHAAALASREPEIDQTVVGNMGSFYRVRVGPFATAQDGQAACAKLKGSGLDCLVVAQ